MLDSKIIVRIAINITSRQFFFLLQKLTSWSSTECRFYSKVNFFFHIFPFLGNYRDLIHTWQKIIISKPISSSHFHLKFKINIRSFVEMCWRFLFLNMLSLQTSKNYFLQFVGRSVFIFRFCFCFSLLCTIFDRDLWPFSLNIVDFKPLICWIWNCWSPGIVDNRIKDHIVLLAD